MSTFRYTDVLTLVPGTQKVSAKAVSSGQSSNLVYSNFQVVGLLQPPVFSPPSNTSLALSEARVLVSSPQQANIWFAVRPGLTASAPSVFPSSEWSLLLVNQTVTLTATSSLFVVLDKMSHIAAVNVSVARYTVVVAPPGSTDAFAGSSPYYLFFLLGLLPLAALIIFGILYYRKYKREKIEDAVFAQHGFNFSRVD